MAQRVRGGLDKWRKRTIAAAADYATGVQQPRRSWQEATAAATPAYEAGVQEAIARGDYAKGVNRVGQQGYLKGVLDKGVPRFAQGVTASGDKYEKNFKPYADFLATVDLPPRSRKGDPANLDRVARVANGLHELKERLRGT